MAQNKYYVSAKYDTINGVFDVGIEVVEENAFMAAIAAFDGMKDDFDTDGITILAVEEVQND